MATISVLFAILEVKKMMERKRNIGNNRWPI